MHRHFTATRMVVLSFAFVIFVGSLLLLLPIAQAQNVARASYLDCLFTAVSATCVTGLVTITTATQWTVFGQIIILLMIQIGGLGLITFFTFFTVNLGRKVNIKNRMNVQATLNQNSMQGMVRFVTLSIKGTFLLEGIGAISLFFFFFFQQNLSFGTAVYYGIFHSISSFCNAGFDIIGNDSLKNFVGYPLLNFTVMFLIVAGGIGFTVWKDLLGMGTYAIKKYKGKKQKRQHFSLHTKLALVTTAILILSGALYFFATEYQNPNTLENLSFFEKGMASFFQSVTLRTAGFYTIPQNALTESSKFTSSIFMLIGGSPGGTAGGIKTVTLAVIICSAFSTLRGKKEPEAMKRTIPRYSVQKAITVFGIMFLLWLSISSILEFTESASNFPFGYFDILFEVSSALGTVGLTTGITPYLSAVGKLLIMACMFIGRLGPISIAISLQRKMKATADTIHYPQEDVLIG